MLGSTDVTNRLFLFIIHVNVLCLFFVFCCCFDEPILWSFWCCSRGEKKGGRTQNVRKLHIAPRKQKAVVLILPVDLIR